MDVNSGCLPTSRQTVQKPKDQIKFQLYHHQLPTPNTNLTPCGQFVSLWVDQNSKSETERTHRKAVHLAKFKRLLAPFLLFN